jgi:hypothetical protein
MKIITSLLPLVEALHDEHFLHNDQPMTCPYCGSRTEELFDISHLINDVGQIHRCFNRSCFRIFIASGDVEEVMRS